MTTAPRPTLTNRSAGSAARRIAATRTAVELLDEDWERGGRLRLADQLQQPAAESMVVPLGMERIDQVLHMIAGVISQRAEGVFGDLWITASHLAE